MTPTDWAEGQHPVQRQAADDLRMPWWWPEAAVLVFILTLALSAAFPWGVA